jgi:hypothetical protein
VNLIINVPLNLIGNSAAPGLHHGWPQTMHAAMQHHHQLAAAAAAAAAAGNRPHPTGAPGSFLAAAAAQHSAMGLGPLSITGGGPSSNPKSLSAQPGIPAFRYT